MKYKRMHIKRFCVSIFIVSLFFITELAVADTEVGGNITDDTTWSKANSPYIVTSTVQVLEGVKLTIEPGVTIRFDKDTGLNIGGELNAIGTVSENIVFTSNETTASTGDWLGIKFNNDSTDATLDPNNLYISGSIIKYSTIQYSDTAISIEYSSHYLSRNHIRHNRTGVLIRYSGTVIAGNLIEFNVIGIEFLSYSVNDNRDFLIIRNDIVNNSAYGIYGRGNTNASIAYNNILKNNVGLHLGGTYTTPTVTNNNIYNNTNYNIKTAINFEDIQAPNNYFGTSSPLCL